MFGTKRHWPGRSVVVAAASAVVVIIIAAAGVAAMHAGTGASASGSGGLDVAGDGQGANVSATVTVTASEAPPLPLPPKVLPSALPWPRPHPTPRPNPAPSPTPTPRPTTPPTYGSTGVTTIVHGLFVVLPLGQVVPAQVSPKDPATVVCSPASFKVAPGAQGTFGCQITSQNGFGGTVSVACDQLVGFGVTTTAEVMPVCNVPSSIVVPPGGSVVVPGTISPPPGATYYTYSEVFLELSSGGAYLQAPNEFQLRADIPPPPPPQFSFACQDVTQTASTDPSNPAGSELLGHCTFTQQNDPGIYSAGVGVELSSSPPGANAQWARFAGQACFGSSAFRSRPDTPCGGTQLAAGQSALATFAISLAQATPGHWVFNILGVESSRVEVLLAFDVQPDGTVTGLQLS